MRHLAPAIAVFLVACRAGDVGGPALDDVAADSLAPLDAAPNLVADATPESFDDVVGDLPTPRDGVADLSRDAGPPPMLRVAQRDVPVTPRGGVRQPSLGFHAGADAFFVTYRPLPVHDVTTAS